MFMGTISTCLTNWVARVLGQRLGQRRLALEHAVREREAMVDVHREPTDYHCIIRIVSLSDFAQTKKIWVLKALNSDFDFDPEIGIDVRVISVVGLFNKGKTFLLNKLFDLHLPSGRTQVTQGLSFVYLKERKMLVIDSPGVQSTVSYKSDGADRVVDAQSTETFIFELISQISDHVIFVVNDFTSFEQLKVQTFEKKELSRNVRAPRELIVVHNLCDAHEVEDAEKLFRKQITSRYDGVESHLGSLVYTARRNPPVHHFAICHDESRAGAEFNQRNFKLLLEHLEHVKKLPERVELAKDVKEKLDDFIPRFFLKSPVDAGVEYCPCKPETILEEDDGDQSKRYCAVGFFQSKCDRLEVKRQGVISELGEVISHDKSFNPEPAIYDEKDAEYLYRTIVVECPGVIDQQVEWEDDGGRFILTITKSKLFDEGSVTIVEGFSSRQQSGIWKKEFHFQDGPFAIGRDSFHLADGVLRVRLKKSLLKRRGRLQAGTAPERSFAVPSSCASEAEGVRQIDLDAHPVAQESECGTLQTLKTSNMGVADSKHCSTTSSWIWTDDGPKTARTLYEEFPKVPSVPSMALKSEDAGVEDACQEPKNGLSPA